MEENATGLEDQNDTTKVALIACDMGFVACPGNQWMVQAGILQYESENCGGELTVAVDVWRG